jgi:hypothetical protein
VLIPVSIRRQLGLKEGESDLLLEIDETPVVGVSMRAQGLVRARAITAKFHKPGDDWAAERCQEARRGAG